jgi:hypothetical protein
VVRGQLRINLHPAEEKPALVAIKVIANLDPRGVQIWPLVRYLHPQRHRPALHHPVQTLYNQANF